MTETQLTERQRKWFASVREGLERDTGRTLAQWVEIARICPESGHRARLKWFKDTHGLLQNRASLVLSELSGPPMWSRPKEVTDALWTDPAARAIYEALNQTAMSLEGTIRTARKGYSAWSRKVQYAAARPTKGGVVLLGLAVPLDLDPGLAPRGAQSWSERLTSRLTLASVAEVDARIERLLAAAWNGA